MTAIDTPVHDIPVRRPKTDLAAAQLERWTVPADPIFSHFLSALSAAFPNGEDFFVQSVRNYRDRISGDPELKARVKGFIGQEAMHGREHRTINEVLAARGYPTEAQDAALLRAAERLQQLPQSLQLATTAASEHFTSVLAIAVLTDPETVDTLFPDPDLRLLIQWHALEELEHKDVAFDLLRNVTRSEVVRAAGLGIAAIGFGVPIVAGYASALWRDRRHLGRAARRTNRRNYYRQRMVRIATLGEVLAYLRPGFHPRDVETDHIVDEWRERLADQMTSPKDRAAATAN